MPRFKEQALKEENDECPELEEAAMETTHETIGPEIHAFIGACETLAGYAQHNGFTDEEREIIMINLLRTLERHIVPGP